MYQVFLSQRAQEFLEKLDNINSERIKERLKKLEDNPIPSDTKFVGRENGEKIFRYRIGDFRALYKVKYAESIVLITKIDKISRVYD